MNYIGRKVKLTDEYIRRYPHYVQDGKNEGVVTDDDNGQKNTCWGVKMDNGTAALPYEPTCNWAECILIDETHQEALDRLQLQVGDKVKILCKANSCERGWRTIWTQQMDSHIGITGKVNAIYKDGVSVYITDEKDRWNYPAYVLEVVERANNNINKTENMQEAPKTVMITSDNKLLVQAMWEDLKKIGYTSSRTTAEQKTDWRYLCTSNSKKYTDSKEGYIGIYLSHPNFNTNEFEIKFNLPEDYTKCLQYMKDAIIYWEEKEKQVMYEVGDWIFITNGGCSIVGKDDCTIKTGSVVKIIEKRAYEEHAATYKTTGGWLSGNTKSHRKATPEEILAACQRVVKIGTAGTEVHINRGEINCQGRVLKIEKLKDILNKMKELKNLNFDWAIEPTVDIAPTCKEGIKGVTLKQVQEIVDAYEEVSNL